MREPSRDATDAEAVDLVRRVVRKVSALRGPASSRSMSVWMAGQVEDWLIGRDVHSDDGPGGAGVPDSEVVRLAQGFIAENWEQRAAG